MGQYRRVPVVLLKQPCTEVFGGFISLENDFTMSTSSSARRFDVSFQFLVILATCRAPITTGIACGPLIDRVIHALVTCFLCNKQVWSVSFFSTKTLIAVPTCQAFGTLGSWLAISTPEARIISVFAFRNIILSAFRVKEYISACST